MKTTHDDVLKKLTKQHSKTTNAHGFCALVIDYAILFGVIYLSVYLNDIFFYIASVWVIGLLQFSISEVLLHEASHNHLFKTPKLNNIMRIFFADPFLIDFDDYKKTHFNHHKHLGDPKYDHIASDYEDYGLYKENKNLFWIWFIKPLIGYTAYDYIVYVIFPYIKAHAIRAILFWLPIFAVCWWSNSLDLLLLYWFIPLLWAASSILYWSEVGDHYNTKSDVRSNLGAIFNLMCHNIGYHSLHHKYPSIPWHNLRKAYNEMKKIDPSLSTDESYGFIFETYKQMK